MTRRIPPAEATEHPWWVIIDPARLRLPHPDDVGDVGPCADCGADSGEPCTLTELDTAYGIGDRRDEPHDGRPDYRDEIETDAIFGCITGPYFSRESAAEHLRSARHRFSKRARVWCLPGSSPEYRALCQEEGP